MLSRRALLLGTLASACSRTRSSAVDGAAGPRRSVHHGVRMLELFAEAASERDPLIVALHGRGGAPENWLGAWDGLHKRAQVVMPRAPASFGDGWSWFEFKDGMTDEQFGAEVGAAEERLWPALEEIAAGRRLVVTGFSQGAFLSYAIASRRGDRVVEALPVSGSCPGPLLPQEGRKPAPIVAFHGTDDDVVEIKWGRAAVRGFVERGGQAKLHEYPGVGHTMTREMRADLLAEIARVLPA